MSNKRIIELDVTDVVEADDFLAIDSVSGKTRRIKPIKIGATYEIEDGEHSFTLVGSNGYRHTVDIPYDSKTINLADFNQLTPEEQDNGTAYYVPDKDVPVADELWAKVGRTQLDGTTQDLSKAHNNLMTRVDDLEDTVGDTALPSGMSSVTDGLSQLNSSKATIKFGTWIPTFGRDTATNVYGNYVVIGRVLFITAQWTNTHSTTGASYINANSLPTIPDFTQSYGFHGTWRSNGTDKGGEIGQFKENQALRFSMNGSSVSLPNEEISFNAICYMSPNN